MSLAETVHHWNTTAAERAARYPCESHVPQPCSRYLRAVDVDAPSTHLFRWVCQLKIAPYSYDWIDNLGRRSPLELTPGADELRIGQSMIVATIVEFEVGHHITAVATPRAARLFGDFSFTYQVTTVDADSSRLLVCLPIAARSRLARLRRALLGAGDLVMMRKQLLTLKTYAESSKPVEAGA